MPPIRLADNIGGSADTPPQQHKPDPPPRHSEPECESGPRRAARIGGTVRSFSRLQRHPRSSRTQPSRRWWNRHWRESGPGPGSGRAPRGRARETEGSRRLTRLTKRCRARRAPGRPRKPGRSPDQAPTPEELSPPPWHHRAPTRYSSWCYTTPPAVSAAPASCSRPWPACRCTSAARRRRARRCPGGVRRARWPGSCSRRRRWR